jgi:hypothetical protein
MDRPSESSKGHLSSKSSSESSKVHLSSKSSLSHTSAVCEPIHWKDILAPITTAKWTPALVRDYLITVVNRMNKHFAMITCGRNIGSIEVTRFNANPAKTPITVTLSSWRCKELFPKKVSICWKEGGKMRRIHTTALSLWMKAGNRREVQLESNAYGATPRRSNAAVKWLTTMLRLAEVNQCPIVFNALNPRHHIYETFLNVIGQSRRNEWSPKKISQAIYRICPQSRPVRGDPPLRLRGEYVINIPSEEICHHMLKKLNITPERP